MVFESQAMRNVQEMIDAVGPTDTTVLILGESGTGKEMVAQAIHERSPRAQRAGTHRRQRPAGKPVRVGTLRP
jgi:transcriptional regulator with GAF, ATPase, and Fis domain